MTNPASDIRLVRHPNLYGEVRSIKVRQGRDIIGSASMFSPARGRGIVWIMLIRLTHTAPSCRLSSLGDPAL